jgi:aspartyl-tRNA(Asn)/glutamyl-tRNA(Gln) amidotransferase subunit C
MRITDKEVRHIAGLAQLELSDAAVTRMGEQLTRILDYIDQLKELELDPSLVVASAEATPLAEDEPRPSLDTAEVAENAPQFAHGLFVVPRVIGGD